MFNPYSVLTLPNHYKELSLKNLEDTMKAYWNASKGSYSEVTCQKFQKRMEKIEKEPDEDKKKKMIFNQLVFLKYYYLKNQKGRDIDILKKAYKMINTEEHRRLYDEKKIAEEHSLEQVPEEKTAEQIWQNYEASVKRCEELSQILQNDMIRTREKTNIQKEIRRGLFTDSPTLTKGICTIDRLSQIAEKNKNRTDPENQFEQYTGMPYRWGFVETRSPDACIINETNIENERVIVIRLGKFLYETFIQSPTEQYPEGKAIYRDSADIIGVSKLDANNQLVRNDIVIARLDSKDPVKDQRYFTEVFVSNRRIDEANLCNNGFIGGILKDKNDQCYIEYNHISDSELVTALEVAKYTGAKKGKNWPTEKVYTFPKIKEIFKKMQEYYTESMIERANKPKVKGEEEWEK